MEGGGKRRERPTWKERRWREKEVGRKRREKEGVEGREMED